MQTRRAIALVQSLIEEMHRTIGPPTRSVYHTAGLRYLHRLLTPATTMVRRLRSYSQRLIAIHLSCSKPHGVTIRFLGPLRFQYGTSRTHVHREMHLDKLVNNGLGLIGRPQATTRTKYHIRRWTHTRFRRGSLLTNGQQHG